jgi:hypothetical protein
MHYIKLQMQYVLLPHLQVQYSQRTYTCTNRTKGTHRIERTDLLYFYTTATTRTLRGNTTCIAPYEPCKYTLIYGHTDIQTHWYLPALNSGVCFTPLHLNRRDKSVFFPSGKVHNCYHLQGGSETHKCCSRHSNNGACTVVHIQGGFSVQ